MAAIAAIIMLAGCDAASDSPAESTSTDTAAAEQAFQQYVADINSGDTAKAAQIYDSAEGFHWVERGGVEYASGAEAAASLRDNFPAGTPISMKVDEIHSAAMGPDAALVSAHYDFTVGSADSEREFTFDGWMTVGMVRREDGWRIAGGQSGPGRSARNPIEPVGEAALEGSVD